MQQEDERAPCDQQSEPVAAAGGGGESEADANRVMLAVDEDSDAGVEAAVSVCSTLWCCCEQIRVAESAACPDRNVFPAKWQIISFIFLFIFANYLIFIF